MRGSRALLNSPLDYATNTYKHSDPSDLIFIVFSCTEI